MKDFLRMLVTACAAVFLSVPALSASDFSGEESPVEKFLELLRTSCVSLECRYELSVAEMVYKGTATGQLQGRAYRMKAGGFDFFCDGKTLWTLDNETGEAVIEPVEETVTGTNPAGLFARLGDFKVVRSASENGRWTYLLTANGDCGIKTAELVLDSAGILLKGKFRLSDGSLKIDVVSMTASAVKPLAYFRPGTDFCDWVVTDLR